MTVKYSTAIFSGSLPGTKKDKSNESKSDIDYIKIVSVFLSGRKDKT